MEKKIKSSDYSFRLFLMKAYFDKGWSMMNYPKNVLAVLGIGAAIQDYSLFYIFLFGLAFGVFCYILGRVMFVYQFVNVENEIQNRFNPFQIEVRNYFKKKKSL